VIAKGKDFSLEDEHRSNPICGLKGIMSRIHEALKKAELEGNAVTAITDTRLPEKQTSVSSKREDLVEFTEISLPSSANVSPRAASLRFEDIRESCARVNWQPDPLKDVFTNRDLGSEAAEQFRTLRSRLYHLRGEKPLRVILVTSAISGDGKTFVASNLAHAIVRQADRRVLLIDADLRSSRLHIPLGAPANPGLCEYLGGSAGEMAVIQHGREDGLYFIAGGKQVSNASELLSNARLKTLIERTAPCFDWIIIDSPPCLPVSDASVIAELCDGVLLVVRSGSTPSRAAHRACDELRKRNVIGIVLNGVNEKSLPYGSYYGQGQYGQAASADSGK
jgi:protein-tyrosine kinase